MSRNRTLTAILFAAATLLSGCGSNEDVISPEALRQQQQTQDAVTFGSYLRDPAATRAGSTGSIDTDKLKESGYGFGVFGYYTGTANYAQSTSANFMYNQQVAWNDALGDEYITKWDYAPLKYWPNEVGTTATAPVDDQDNDTSSDPATGSATYGGNVSFFAYAPYVALNAVGGTAIEIANGGITAINGSKTLEGNSLTQDPKIEYTIPSEGNKIVDLLWGTRGETSVNVVGGANAGVASTATDNPVVTTPLTGSHTYAADILQGYTVNADLTKQKTNGTVNFLFKHALAKVGGSTVTTSTSPTSKNGLMIILDLDDLMGGECGGYLEPYVGDITDRTKYNTKVTVHEVTIVGRSLLENSNKKPGDANYSALYLSPAKGTFDLATGKWTLGTGTTDNQSSAASTEYVITSPASDATATGKSAATLADYLAEPTGLSATINTKAYFEALPLGVLTDAQNVFGNEANPLVFIPGTYPELTITITYTVRTYDENLSLAYSEVTQRITKKLTFTEPVQLNKQYSLLMHLGLTSVKFTATVSDWERWITAIDENGVLVQEDAVEHVYLPRNVGEPSAEDQDKGTGATITVGGKNYIIMFSQEGVEDGQTYFATEKPLIIRAYEVAANGTKTAIDLDGTTNSIIVTCGCTASHFHRNVTGEYDYGDTNSDGKSDLTLTPKGDDIRIKHCPVTFTLTIDGKSSKASSTINIWPKNYLPY